MKSRRVSLGGLLSIYNCMFWVGLFALGRVNMAFAETAMERLFPHNRVFRQ
jgi:hypothetical protein